MIKFIIKYPAPLQPNKFAFKVVEAATKEHAEVYVKWMYNIESKQVTAICETNTKPDFRVNVNELQDLDLI